jgi:superfamily II DNA or RNA helicase
MQEINVLRVVSPVEAELYTDVSQETIVKSLTYTDKRVDFELRSVNHALDMLRKFGNQSNSKAARISALEARQATLLSDRTKTLATIQNGLIRVPSGLCERLAKQFGFTIKVAHRIPDFPVPLHAKRGTHQAREYQVLAHDLLLSSTRQYGMPAGVELATGGGKTTVIRDLVRTLGRLGVLIMAPSRSIAAQIFSELSTTFGSNLVGRFGDGKKEHNRLIVVGIDDSLTRVKPDSPAWKSLSAKQVFISDESHLCPSETLSQVCFGLAAGAPYRYFFSGTQLRNDGLDLVLEGIIGRVVLRKNVRELVHEGYLARPTFRMVRVRTDSVLSTTDANVMTRKHLYYNKNVHEAVGKLCNMFVHQMQRPVVVLVEEIEQFTCLNQHLSGCTVAFAHSTLREGAQVPEPYASQKPEDAVAAFNAGKVQVLIGTSCIATGTDIKVAEAGIYLMGGKSEIKIRQGVGRETRGGVNSTVTNPWTGKQKLDFVHVDFDVVNTMLPESEQDSFLLHKHAKARAKIYKEIYEAPEMVDML